MKNKPGDLSKHSTGQHCGPSAEVEDTIAGEHFSTSLTSRVLPIKGRSEACTTDHPTAIQEKRTWHGTKCKCSEDDRAKAKKGKGQGKAFCFSQFEHSKDLL